MEVEITGTGGKTLMSKWNGLHHSLIGSIYPCKPDGQGLVGNRVAGPVRDCHVEVTAQWTSLFENSGLNAKFPTLMGLAQSGEVGALARSVSPSPTSNALGASLVRDLVAGSERFSNAVQGRSGLTKLNSTLIHTGAVPLKVPLTMYFRSYDDPAAEVQRPLDQIAEWALPRHLADGGSLRAGIEAYRSGAGALHSVLPSLIPQMIGFSYGNFSFAPMVIESMTLPLSVPRDDKGRPLFAGVQLTLSTLHALDASDWRRASFKV